MPYNPTAYASAIAPPEPSSAQTSSEAVAFEQLIDAKEFVRLLGFHLASMPTLPLDEQQKYCKAVIAHAHFGGLLKNTGIESAAGVITPSPIGENLRVRSHWVFSTRDLNQQYWRGYVRTGYKNEPFPHFFESRLALDQLVCFLTAQNSAAIGVPGAEYVDICQEILLLYSSRSQSRWLLLSTSRAALALAHNPKTHQVKLRANAGQRVMGVKQAYGWLSGKLEKASNAKRKMFEDLSLAAFCARPSRFLGLWDFISEKEGTARYKELIKKANGGEVDLPGYDMSLSKSCVEYPSVQIRDEVERIRPQFSGRSGDKIVSEKELDALTRYIVGTGYGLPVQPVRLPVAVGVVKN